MAFSSSGALSEKFELPEGGPTGPLEKPLGLAALRGGLLDWPPPSMESLLDLERLF